MSNQHNNDTFDELQDSKHPNYKTFYKRMQSFQFLYTAINPKVMSEAGFFAEVDRGFVRCFHCGLGLKNWDEDDDPYVEHCRWYPNCQYMKIKKGQAFIDAVQEAVKTVQMEEALGQDAVTEVKEILSSQLENVANNELYRLSVLKRNPLLCTAAQSLI